MHFLPSFANIPGLTFSFNYCCTLPKVRRELASCNKIIAYKMFTNSVATNFSCPQVQPLPVLGGQQLIRWLCVKLFLLLFTSFPTILIPCLLQKVHTFQASLEAVLAQLGDAEQSQKSLTSNQADSEPQAFRNQLKVGHGGVILSR